MMILLGNDYYESICEKINSQVLSDVKTLSPIVLICTGKLGCKNRNSKKSLEIFKLRTVYTGVHFFNYENIGPQSRFSHSQFPSTTTVLVPGTHLIIQYFFIPTFGEVHISLAEQ